MKSNLGELIKLVKNAFLSKIKSSILNIITVITSAVCMGSVTTVGMVGMVTGQVSTVGVVLQAIGLGFLTTIPDYILRPILIFVIAINLVGAYLSFRVQRYFPPFLLTLIGVVLLYPSIYIFSFETLYYFSLGVLLIATAWNVILHKRLKGSYF